MPSTHALRTLLFLILISAVVGQNSAHAQCTDWGAVTDVPPVASWDGPNFANRAGGTVQDGFLMKWSSTGTEAWYEFYDIRDLANPVKIYETYISSQFGTGNLYIAATQDSLCAIGYGGPFGSDIFLVLADDPMTTHFAHLSGSAAVSGTRMFQIAFDWLDGVAGVGYYDISDPATIGDLGFHGENLDTTVKPFAISDEIVLVRTSGGLLQAVDFQDPANPVVRSSVFADQWIWLGRVGDRVYFSDNSSFYGLDVSDPDSMQIDFNTPVVVKSMAVRGNLAALAYGNPAVERLQIVDLSGAGAPVPVSPAFGGFSDGSVSWDGDVIYTADFAAYDVSDPASPVLAGTATATLANGTYVQNGYLVTGHGLYPTHCAVPAAVGETPGAHPAFNASPNPFNPQTTFTFEIARPGFVTLDIFDPRGGLVRRLVRENLGSGSQMITWDGRDERGRAAPAGVYLARLADAAGETMMKVTMVK